MFTTIPTSLEMGLKTGDSYIFHFKIIK